MPCSRTQHGLTRVGLEPPTSGSGVRDINHQDTALPHVLFMLYDAHKSKISTRILHSAGMQYQTDMSQCKTKPMVWASRIVKVDSLMNVMSSMASLGLRLRT